MKIGLEVDVVEKMERDLLVAVAAAAKAAFEGEGDAEIEMHNLHQISQRILDADLKQTACAA